MAETPARCRIGIVGCGRATRELHLPALARVPEVAVAALCDLDHDLARRTAAEHGIPHAHGALDGLLARDDLDAIAVCVPPAHHAVTAIAVLDAGRHLFVEKPLALTLDDCDRIIARAADARRRAVVGFNLRQHRLIRAARARIQAGELGRIELIRSTFTSDIALSRALPEWRHARAAGGGVLFELGVHHFDLWRHLTGLAFDEVFAYRSGAGSHDRTATVTARATDGALATAQLSEATHAGNELEILGERGRMQISLYDFDGLRVTPTPTPPGGLGNRVRGLRHTLSALPAALAAARSGGDWKTTFEEEWRRFAETVAAGAPPAATLADGRAAVHLSIAAAESVARGRPVRID